MHAYIENNEVDHDENDVKGGSNDTLEPPNNRFGILRTQGNVNVIGKEQAKRKAHSQQGHKDMQPCRELVR